MNNDPTLITQGETIATALMQQGYVTQKLDHQLAWGVSQADEDWWMLLTFIPRPTAQWRLLPAAHNENQTKLYSIIEQTIHTQMHLKGGKQQTGA